jgi:hypothetical protein
MKTATSLTLVEPGQYRRERLAAPQPAAARLGLL